MQYDIFNNMVEFHLLPNYLRNKIKLIYKQLKNMDKRIYVKKWQLTVLSPGAFITYIEGNKELYVKVEWDKSTVSESEDREKIIVDCTFKNQQYGSSLAKWFMNTGITFKPMLSLIEKLLVVNNE